MEFNVSTDSIQRAVKVLGIVVRTNAVDATGRVLIEAKDGVVVFMSNNGATGLSFTVKDAEVIEEGVIAITYSKIKSFVTSFRPWDEESGVKSFNFVADERTTTINVQNIFANGKSSKSKLKLTNFNPALVQRIPPFEEVSFTLISNIFREAANKVLYAIDPQTDYNQAALQGMNIQFGDDRIFFAGSDGVVLSEYEAPNKTGRVDGNVTLQYDFIMGLRRLLSDDIELEWEIKGNRVSLRFEEIVYTGRRIIGHDFPDYKPALEDYTDHINLNKDFLTSSLRPFVDLLDPEDNFRLTFEIKDKMLRIFNTQANVEAEQDIIGGLDYSIDLNGRHLLQTIEAIVADDILFKFSDEKGFAIFDASHQQTQKALISSIKKR